MAKAIHILDHRFDEIRPARGIAECGQIPWHTRLRMEWDGVTCLVCLKVRGVKPGGPNARYDRTLAHERRESFR